MPRGPRLDARDILYHVGQGIECFKLLPFAAVAQEALQKGAYVCHIA